MVLEKCGSQVEAKVNPSKPQLSHARVLSIIAQGSVTRGWMNVGTPGSVFISSKSLVVVGAVGNTHKQVSCPGLHAKSSV